MEKNNVCDLTSPIHQAEEASLKPSNGKYCLIVKRPDFDGYGFNLHSEKAKPGQFIGKVDADSPAETAGLLEGDQIIEVNGVNIGDETHKQVVQRIKAISNEVRLFLIDVNPEAAYYCKKDQISKPEQKTVPSGGNNFVNNTYSVRILPAEDKIFLSKNAAVLSSTAAPEVQIENGCNKNQISKESSTTYCKNLGLNVSDNAPNATNGHQTKTNGQAEELVTTTAADSFAAPTIRKGSIEQRSQDVTMLKTGLNLNLTAAEMRAKLLVKKKLDPKNDCVDLKKKFDIIQKL